MALPVERNGPRLRRTLPAREERKRLGGPALAPEEPRCPRLRRNGRRRPGLADALTAVHHVRTLSPVFAPPVQPRDAWIIQPKAYRKFRPRRLAQRARISR